MGVYLCTKQARETPCVHACDDLSRAAFPVDGRVELVVVLVVAVRLYRDGIAEILGRADGICVAAALPSWQYALPAIVASRADVVLLDLSLPESVGALAALRRVEPEPKVVVLGLTETEVDV